MQENIPSVLENTLTANEVCELTGIGRTTLDSWVRRGLLPAPFRFGLRRLYWDREEVVAALATMRKERAA